MVMSAGLQHLADMNTLEILNLDSREIGYEGLKHLRSLKKLCLLDIFSGRVTDDGVFTSRLSSPWNRWSCAEEASGTEDVRI